MSEVAETVADVDEIVRTREELHAEMRGLLGVAQDGSEAPPFRQVLRDNRVGMYPLAALGILSIVDSFQSFAFSVLAPDISHALGVGKGAIAAAIAVSTFATVLGPLPFAAAAQRPGRRVPLIIATGIAWSLVAITTGYVTAMVGLLFVLVLDGLTTASTLALHNPFLVDTYPPPTRVRALGIHTGFNQLGNVLAPLLVAVLTAWGHLTWRGVFVVLGFISLAGALSCLRLRDPGVGRWDTQQIRSVVREREGASDDLAEDDVALGFFEVMRRVMLIPTMRRLFIGQAVIGVLTIPLQVFLAFYFEERWNLGPGARGLFSAGRSAMAIVVLLALGKEAETRFRRNPRRALWTCGIIEAIGVLVVGAAVTIPSLPAVVILLTIAISLFWLILPTLNVAVQTVVPATMRPHTGALLGIAIATGGLAGSLLLGGVDRRYGIVGSLVALVIPGVLGALIIGSAGKLVVADLDRMIDETIEEEEIRQLSASGRKLPMLAARGVDFSYGQVQVLFGVDFTVDDGEMVALLGTNGAGKSTLLKVISGIGLPSAGSVRYRGADITYLDAERRLRLGITQIPGGRAVFGPMTVTENLRVFGHTIRRDRKAIDGAIERSFEAFPRLAERRDQKALTLSGGEQQMLGLSKALMLQPRLLLIDELSLGLAPIIVGQLLDMVKEINEQGTAVVLVEQSVNIALGLVDHAYFMEKGEIRFDGPSAELLERGDLLRAVFLEGASSR